MISGFKRRAGNKALKKQREEMKCERRFHNFATAKSVALLYPYEKTTEAEITDFVKFLAARKIKVCTLAYSPTATVPASFQPAANRNIFCKKQLNWFQKPASPEIDSFIANPFDILIDLSGEKQFPLHYIVALSCAAMRVVRLSYPDNPYELLLSAPSTASGKEYIEQVKKYLQIIQVQ